MKKLIPIRASAWHPQAVTAGWFEDLSKEKQKEYIKTHPNSKYAKAAGKKSAPVKDKAPSPAKKAEKAPAKLITYDEAYKKMRKLSQTNEVDMHQHLQHLLKTSDPSRAPGIKKQIQALDNHPNVVKYNKAKEVYDKLK